MLKVAILAGALAAASAALAVRPDAAPVEAPACHRAAPSPETDCTPGALDPTAPAAEPDVLAASPAPVVDWPALHPAPRAGLAFKDVAAEPAPAVAAMPDGERRHGLVPALFALGALVVLLRKRPL
jgi:hypothetical protein